MCGAVLCRVARSHGRTVGVVVGRTHFTHGCFHGTVTALYTTACCLLEGEYILEFIRNAVHASVT